jgi:hypothetical protein
MRWAAVPSRADPAESARDLRLMARDFPLDDRLRRLLASGAVDAWLREHVAHGAAPAWGENGQLAYRFEDADEAQRFRDRWLG